MQLPDSQLAWPVSYAAICEIARSEGLRLTAYRCQAGVWTIGRGHTAGVRPGDRLDSAAAADQLLLHDLTILCRQLEALLTRPASANELGAMLSLAYNIGLAGFARSTVLRQHNAGNRQAAARAFGLWNRVGGIESAGLTARRAREKALYLEPEEQEAPAMPQAVDPESRLHRSPLAQSGMVTLLSGAATAAASIAEPLQRATGDTGVQPGLLLAILLLLVGAVVLWQRLQQRQEGWA